MDDQSPPAPPRAAVDRYPESARGGPCSVGRPTVEHDVNPDRAKRPDATSRRGFLGGTALGGLGLALLGPARDLLADDATPGAAADAAMSASADPVNPVKVSLTLNGQKRDLTLDSRATLLDTLRTNVGLTGTKKGCDHGACGACTCHVDGEAVLSCLTLAAQLDGATVTTIEGLAPGGPDGGLHVLQEEFIACDGFQCGYCTPGQIMSGVKVIDQGRLGSDDEIREWMSGNLCRCGAYNGIVDAVKNAATRMGKKVGGGTIPPTGGAILEGV